MNAMTLPKIAAALNNYAASRESKIAKKYNGDVGAFKKAIFIGEVKTIVGAKSWSKNEISHVYFNDKNFYVCESTMEINAIDQDQQIDLDNVDAYLAKYISE